MATAYPRVSGDARRLASSSYSGLGRYENRVPMSSTLCRNGPQCRKFQEGTCHFNHDFTTMPPNGFNLSAKPVDLVLSSNVLTADSSKKSLSVESPSFTPKTSNAQLAKNLGISPKAAAAAAFTPRGSGTPGRGRASPNNNIMHAYRKKGNVTPAGNAHSKESSADYLTQQPFTSVQAFQEFVPGQSYLQAQQQQLSAFSDPFLTQQALSGLDASQATINPYAQQASTVGAQAFFQDATGFKHPLNYHLYASVGPRRENMLAFQRSASDFFIPDDLREDLQRKSEAALQTYANSTLPQSLEYFHSLVALDTNHQKGSPTFGLTSWIYKATSGRDGHIYALRRIEGFRLTNEAAIKTTNAWKRISSASLVQVHDAFTGRWFGDSSLIVVTDYYPRSQTLAEKHFSTGRASHGRAGGPITGENELWGYIVQLASALKTIHEGGLAAQTVTLSKVLLTSKNRLRLNGCAVFDILQHDQRRPVVELQRADLQDLGRLVLAIAARNATAHQNTPKSLETVSRSYSERLRSCIAWLVAPPAQPEGKTASENAGQSADFTVHTLLNNIADKVVGTLDSTLHHEDDLTSNLMQELENGRIARLLTKLNVIIDRPESGNSVNTTSAAPTLNQPSSAWSETGERYYLKLFRDYVFHQVDHEGRPVLDLGHILTCLNKLDAGIEERIRLISRDEQNEFIVSYKEVKRAFEAAWAELSKASNPSRR